MNAFRRACVVISAFCAAVVVNLSMSVAGAEPVSIYAAGSLREVMQALEKSYTEERHASSSASATPSLQFLFGPSGKLRERIESGDMVHIFASASPEHTDRLLKAGKLRSSNVFASNSLCVIARPGFALIEEKLVETLLAPDVVVGTSTPGADPAGDYTWEMFRKIGASRPGAFETLDRKAQKLAGAEVNASDTRAPYVRLLTEKRADLFVTYCTNASSARKENPAITSVKVPATYDVATSYAIGLSVDAPDSARDFLRYVLSQRAQTVMAGFGFAPPVAGCGIVEPMLKEAHAAWMGGSSERTALSGRESSPPVESGKRIKLTLQSVTDLAFVPATDVKSAGTWGGSVAFTALQSGHLEVFLDRRAWVYLVRMSDKKALDSIRSDRWLGCAGVGKNLGFTVTVGEHYELRLSRVDGPVVAALLMPMTIVSAVQSSK